VVENKRTSESIVLVQCGTPAPTNLGNTTQVYQIPITKAAVMETTVVPYLEVRKKNKRWIHLKEINVK
jgi:hypothetical protein